MLYSGRSGVKKLQMRFFDGVHKKKKQIDQFQKPFRGSFCNLICYRTACFSKFWSIWATYFCGFKYVPPIRRTLSLPMCYFSTSSSFLKNPKKIALVQVFARECTFNPFRYINIISFASEIFAINFLVVYWAAEFKSRETWISNRVYYVRKKLVFWFSE